MLPSSSNFHHSVHKTNDSKSGSPHGLVGSNPTASAITNGIPQFMRSVLFFLCSEATCFLSPSDWWWFTNTWSWPVWLRCDEVIKSINHGLCWCQFWGEVQMRPAISGGCKLTLEGLKGASTWFPCHRVNLSLFFPDSWPWSGPGTWIWQAAPGCKTACP